MKEGQMEKLNFKVGITGENKIRSKPPLTLAKAIAAIKAKEYPKAIEDDLIKEISKQPRSTFSDFLKNIYTHMNKIQARKNKE